MSDIKDVLSIEKLDVYNYPTWKVNVTFHLKYKGLWTAIEGGTTTQAEDSKALALIGLTVERHQQRIIAACATAKAAWDILAETYENKCATSKRQHRERLVRMRKDPSEPLSKYFSRAKGVVADCIAAGLKVSEEETVCAVITGLPAEYDTIVTVIEDSTNEEDMTLDNLLPKLMRVEARLGNASAFVPEDYRALYTKPSRGTTGLICNYCHKVGHREAECYGKRRDMERRSAIPYGSHATSFGNRRYGGDAASVAPRRRGPVGPPAAPAARPARSPAARARRIETDREPVAFTSKTDIPKTTPSQWILDSGASRHITPDIGRMFAVTELDRPIPVTFANGSTGSAVAVGSVLLKVSSTDIILHEVLYVPSAADNLLSIPYSTGLGIQFVFEQEGCHMFSSEKKVATAYKHGGLYVLDTDHDGPDGIAACVSKVNKTPALWHYRYGHLSYGNLKRLVDMDMVTGIGLKASEFANATSPGDVCEPCIIANHPRAPFKPSNSGAGAPLDLLHMDLCGPVNPPTLGGSRYMATYYDDYSKLSVVQLLNKKSDVTSTTIEVINLLENQTGLTVRKIRSDNGSEYVNQWLSSFLKSKGILHQTTTVATPQQNGKAERLNRTLLEKARAMLTASGLDDNLWGEAISTANYLRNRSPTVHSDKTPWELFYGERPDVSNLRVFGSTAYVRIPPEHRRKLDQASSRGIMIGYGATTKGWKVRLDTGKIVVSRDVVFDENHFMDLAERQDSAADLLESDTDDDSPPDNEEGNSPESTPRPGPKTGSKPQPTASEMRYPRRDRKAPGEWYKSASVTAYSTIIKEPTTLTEALNSEQADYWREAMDDEIKSIKENNTWTLEEPPAGYKPIPTKFIYKVKYTPSGTIERFKARLVCQGFRQKEGIDYDEIYAPVSKYSTLRALLAKVCIDNMELHHLDIKTAFLNGEIDTLVYVTQPPGYEECPSYFACRLNKGLYGLKQAPRIWNTRLKTVLGDIGFIESSADPSLFISPEGYILTYVDDLLIAAKELGTVREIKSRLTSAFDARDLGEASFFLGMTIRRDRSAGSLSMGQEHMIRDIISKYDLDSCKPKATPLSASLKMMKTGEPLDSSVPYSALVGSLLYLSISTRPDIAYSVGVCARFMACPTIDHWNAAKGIVRYLSTTAGHGLNFSSQKPLMYGYCDADYAGDLDTRRSTTGYVFIYGGAAITWQSRRQPTVAASTAEAEYMAAANAVKEALWLRKLCNDLQMTEDTGATLMYADNQSAITLLKNPITSMRSKHIDVAYHFARERVIRDEINVQYVSTDKMVADALTKALPPAKHDYCCKHMGLY